MKKIQPFNSYSTFFHIFLINDFIDIYFAYQKIHLFKVYSSLVFLYIHRGVQPSPLSILGHFHHPPKEISYPLATILNTSYFPSPRTPLIYVLSPYMCLFWTFHVRGLAWYLFFHDWLLSLSVMFSRSSSVVACVSAPFLFISE